MHFVCTATILLTPEQGHYVKVCEAAGESLSRNVQSSLAVPAVPVDKAPASTKTLSHQSPNSSTVSPPPASRDRDAEAQGEKRTFKIPNVYFGPIGFRTATVESCPIICRLGNECAFDIFCPYCRGNAEFCEDTKSVEYISGPERFD